MRIFLAVIVLIFSFQSWTKADDIRDFEIEGMSIGDSLLDFYDISILKNIDRYYYPNSKKYFGLTDAIFDKNLETYESIQFLVKPEKYEIVHQTTERTLPNTYSFYFKVFNIISLGPGLKTKD